jgi:opacity protein-like surface antigen
MLHTIRVFVLVVTVWAISSQSQSQIRQGTWEFSFSATAGEVSGSSEYSSSFGTSTFNSTFKMASQKYVSLVVRPGFYVVDGLELEPEVYLTAVDGSPPAIALSGNLAYNISIPESRVTPFLLVGYGVGNGIPVLGRLLTRSSADLDITVLNAGAGVKVFIVDHVAFRVEYRHQRFSYEDSGGSAPFFFTTKFSQNFNNILFGLSVFLP